MQQVTFPVRVMQMLGVKTLFVSNAAGGMNPDFKVGDLMIITDHINTFPDNPLRGKNYEELGPRFPDMSETYTPRLIEKALEIARRNHIEVRQGVYVGTQGPSFETPAEYPLLPYNRRRCRGYVDRTPKSSLLTTAGWKFLPCRSLPTSADSETS